jgi:hypothetical protein
MKQCVEIVTPSGTYGAFHQHKCGVRASVEHEGKWYCRRHDPKKRIERRSKRDEEYAAFVRDDSAREQAAQERIAKLGYGTTHARLNVATKRIECSGGVVLSAEDADELITAIEYLKDKHYGG